MKWFLHTVVLSSLLTLPALAGSISAGTETKYPTEFQVITRTVNGKTVTKVVPTRFETRHTGTRMAPEFVGVSRRVGKDSWGKDIVQLRFSEGQEAQVKTGQTIKVDGIKYLALGWRGKDYCLRNMKTRKTVKFQPAKTES